jgi:hypothetical protein
MWNVIGLLFTTTIIIDRIPTGDQTPRGGVSESLQPAYVVQVLDGPAQRVVPISLWCSLCRPSLL